MILISCSLDLFLFFYQCLKMSIRDNGATGVSMRWKCCKLLSRGQDAEFQSMRNVIEFRAHD